MERDTQNVLYMSGREKVQRKNQLLVKHGQKSWQKVRENQANKMNVWVGLPSWGNRTHHAVLGQWLLTETKPKLDQTDKPCKGVRR